MVSESINYTNAFTRLVFAIFKTQPQNWSKCGQIWQLVKICLDNEGPETRVLWLVHSVSHSCNSSCDETIHTIKSVVIVRKRGNFFILTINIAGMLTIHTGFNIPYDYDCIYDYDASLNHLIHRSNRNFNTLSPLCGQTQGIETFVSDCPTKKGL